MHSGGTGWCGSRAKDGEGSPIGRSLRVTWPSLTWPEFPPRPGSVAGVTRAWNAPGSIPNHRLYVGVSSPFWSMIPAWISDSRNSSGVIFRMSSRTYAKGLSLYFASSAASGPAVPAVRPDVPDREDVFLGPDVDLDVRFFITASSARISSMEDAYPPAWIAGPYQSSRYVRSPRSSS